MTTTVTDMSTGSSVHPIDFSTDPNLVKVKVEYPAKFEGQKFYKDGDTPFVSRETADKMIEDGIAKEVKRTKDEKAAAEGTDGKNSGDESASGVTSTSSVKVDDAAAATIASKEATGKK